MIRGNITAETLERIKEVSAHLHRNYTVKLTDTVTEYILAPFYEGNVAFITITGVNDEK